MERIYTFDLHSHLNEKNAFLFAPEDKRALAEQMQRVIHDADEAVRRAAQAAADAHRYSWKARAEKINRMLAMADGLMHQKGVPLSVLSDRLRMLAANGPREAAQAFRAASAVLDAANPQHNPRWLAQYAKSLRDKEGAP